MKENANFEEFFNFDKIMIPTKEPTPVILQLTDAPDRSEFEQAC